MAKKKEAPKENPIVMLLAKSDNATSEQNGFIPMKFPYKQAKELLTAKYRGRFKHNPEDENYKLINGELIKQSTGG